MKEHYIKSIHRGRETIYKGTMEYLVNRVFGYTLECGHSWDKSVNENPKTPKALVNALNKSAYTCNNYMDSYELSSEEEYNMTHKN